jgi:hypothetical protein
LDLLVLDQKTPVHIKEVLVVEVKRKVLLQVQIIDYQTMLNLLDNYQIVKIHLVDRKDSHQLHKNQMLINPLILLKWINSHLVLSKLPHKIDKIQIIEVVAIITGIKTPKQHNNKHKTNIRIRQAQIKYQFMIDYMVINKNKLQNKMYKY